MQNASTLLHRVSFHETDAMGIVHHSNYLRYFEQVRVLWLEEHDQPYMAYMEQDLHFAVTRVEVDYKKSARFDDRIEVTTWLEYIRGASLRMAYRIIRRDELLITGATEHATVDTEGRLRRIPRDRRTLLMAKVEAPENG